jgi:hypothetical protein
MKMNMTTLILTLALGHSVLIAQPVSKNYQCTLPYLNGGGVVTLVSASDRDQLIEITANNAYSYKVVVQKNSSYSFPSPVFGDFFSPIVHGGPMSFKSDQPIIAYTVLGEDSITVQCSDPTKPTKIFMGSARTGLAIVNITRSPIRVQIFQDTEHTPILTLTIAGEGRQMGYMGDTFPISGNHSYRLVADSEGIGLLAISYDRDNASSIPIGEYAATENSDSPILPGTLSSVK